MRQQISKLFAVFCLLLMGVLLMSAVKATARQSGAESTGALAQAKQNWSFRGGSLGQTYFSELSSINVQNVKNLGATWISEKFADAATSRVTPIVKDGVMFYSAGARVYAVDARTGKPVWTYLTAVVAGRVQVGAGGANGAGVPNNQGVVVADGLVYVGLMNAHAIALDEKTGKLVWDRDLSDYLPKPKRWIAAAPTYANGVLYWSITNNERWIGRAIALDGKTGHELWHFDVIPGPGEPGHETWAQNTNAWKMGGGNIWITPAVDPDLGLVYYGTGNPDLIHAGETRPGNNLYTCSVVALDIKTGKLKWYYQLTHHDLWEQDLGTPIILYDLEMGGRMRKGLAAFRKDGRLFLLDRETGKPLLPITERPVPQDAYVKTAPTQPFQQGDSIIEDCASYWKGKIPVGFELGCDYTPPKIGVYNVLTPRIGAMFQPISFDPQTGYFYVQGKTLLKSSGRADDPLFQDMGGTSNIAARAPGFGKYELYEIGAIDGRTNKIVWKKVLPPVNGFGTGGWLTTAGGLAFHRMLDGNLEAFDAKTGDELWKFQTGVGVGDGTPSSYEVDGKQYVAVVEQSAVWVFALGGNLPQGVAPPPPGPFQDIQGPIKNTDTIRSASLVQDYFGDRWRTDEWSFDPYRARIAVGAPMTIINNGRQPHTIEAVDGSWTTGLLKPNDQTVLTFDKPGEYLYHRKEHPWSYGQIIVVANTGVGAGAGAAQGVGAQAPGGFAAQADTGKAAYAQSCTICHASNLGGNGEAAPALVGDEFLGRWTGRTAGDLFDKVRTTMPTGAVGSLSNDAYRDIVAYILQANEFPVGREALREDALKNISMTKR